MTVIDSYVSGGALSWVLSAKDIVGEIGNQSCAIKLAARTKDYDTLTLTLKIGIAGAPRGTYKFVLYDINHNILDQSAGQLLQLLTTTKTNKTLTFTPATKILASQDYLVGCHVTAATVLDSNNLMILDFQTFTARVFHFKTSDAWDSNNSALTFQLDGSEVVPAAGPFGDGITLWT